MPQAPEPRYPDRDRNPQGRAENQRPRDRFGAPLPRGAVDEMPARVDPAEVVSDVADALVKAAALFDAQRFFEAHEFFEWIWKSDLVAEADRNFFKGLAQVAVGMTHTQRGNATGAVTLLQRAARHLGPYPTPHHGVDTSAVRDLALAFAATVRSEGASPDRQFPRFPPHVPG